MIFNLFRKSTVPGPALEGYRSIVAQSRQPKFYADWNVPDTVTGRFDMISLHMILLMHRLRGDAAGREFAQALVDVFFRDMDHSIRELGVTDIGVPSKVKKMGNAFYGLVSVLGVALDARDATEIEAILVKNIYGAPDAHAADLAQYLLDDAARLAALPVSELTAPKGAAA